MPQVFESLRDGRWDNFGWSCLPVFIISDGVGGFWKFDSYTLSFHGDETRERVCY
jgi:hypothetical protein